MMMNLYSPRAMITCLESWSNKTVWTRLSPSLRYTASMCGSVINDSIWLRTIEGTISV